MTRAVCPGSFDPVTHGHLDVIERTAVLFDQVVVAVGANPSKTALFTPDERVAMLERGCSEWPGVSVALFGGLLVDFCVTEEITVISKGLRSGDFAYELSMAQMNRRLSGVDTVFVPTDPQWSYVSSSLVREIATMGGDIGAFVSAEVAEQTRTRVAQRRDEAQ